MAEKDDLYPMGREAARAASRQMADEEFWTELVNQLEPELRFGGKYGLISALGLGKGADRTKVSPYGMRDTERAEQVGRESQLLRSPLLGYYKPRRARDDATPKGFSAIHEFVPGGKAPAPGGNVAAFYPMVSGAVADNYRKARTFNFGHGFPSTVQHELFHKGMDSPAVQAFISETGTRPPYSAHSVLEAIQPSSDNEEMAAQIRGRHDEFSSKLLDWLNEGSAERFGVYVPTRSAEPKEEESMVDKILRILGLDAQTTSLEAPGQAHITDFQIY